MIYVGIGARATPDHILEAMESMGRFMAEHGHTLRSGGARGADQAFEIGCDQRSGTKEIYLPHKGFQGSRSPLFGSCREARMIASKYHPKWDALGSYVRDLMARNSYQILGKDLKTPADFVVCWTPGGREVGGTSQAIRIAKDYDIPVINLGSDTLSEAEEKVMKILKS